MQYRVVYARDSLTRCSCVARRVNTQLANARGDAGNSLEVLSLRMSSDFLLGQVPWLPVAGCRNERTGILCVRNVTPIPKGSVLVELSPFSC